MVGLNLLNKLKAKVTEICMKALSNTFAVLGAQRMVFRAKV